MNKYTALIERFFSVSPMTVSSQPGKEIESKSYVDCFAMLAMTPIILYARSLRAQRSNLYQNLLIRMNLNKQNML
jgi:hypothetical protein